MKELASTVQQTRNLSYDAKHNNSIAINEMLQMCRKRHHLLLELNGNISYGHVTSKCEKRNDVICSSDIRETTSHSDATSVIYKLV